MVENRLAWEVYTKVVTLSTPDFGGLPTLEKLDFYFKYCDLEITQDELDDLIDKLSIINNLRRYLLYEYEKVRSGS